MSIKIPFICEIEFGSREDVERNARVLADRPRGKACIQWLKDNPEKVTVRSLVESGDAHITLSWCKGECATGGEFVAKAVYKGEVIARYNKYATNAIESLLNTHVKVPS